MKARVVALVAAASIVGAGLVVPAAEVPVVTGHTTFADMAGMDPCLGAVAGIVEAEVLWFDDSIFHKRTNFENDRWVYASHVTAGDPTAHVQYDNVSEIEDNADDRPPDKVLIRSGVWYNFTDPNGVYWNVTEVFWDDPFGTRVTDDTGSVVSGDVQGGAANTSAETRRHYAWIVKIGPTTTDDYLSGLDDFGDRYNFVNMINTCKFSYEAENLSERQHTSGSDEDGFLHPDKYDTDHTHETWKIELRVGPEPDAVPLDAEPANKVTAWNVAERMSGARAE